MIVLRDLPTPSAGQPQPQASAPRAVTLGFFDGLHLGHRRLLGDLKAWARAEGAETAVVTFDRHPQEVLTGKGPPRVLSLDHRLLLLAREGLSAILVLPFTTETALWSPEDFVRRAVVDALGGRWLLLGFDAAFGRGRQGTFSYTAPRAGALGIAVRQAGVESLDGARVSSTLVREAVLAGDLPRLERLLGRRYSLLGAVARGEGRGRSIGFPTANVETAGAALPPLGVYFARLLRLGPSLDAVLAGRGPAGPWLPAVVNIGRRPTFHDPSAARETVEAHVLDWSGDLYGEHVEVELVRRHRDERKFPTAEALIEQIRADAGACRRFLAGRA